MIHVLDTLQLGNERIIAATALETTEGIALFDTGAESTFENIADALTGLGADAREVRHVFLSHIHLDHAGAAWRFAETGATIYVHPRGAAHLLDPSKLADSAQRIFGDAMEKLWGRIAPVPSERVRVLEDRETVKIGDLEIRALATPGHASHHHVYHWGDTLFGGDIAGVRIGDGPPMPPFVPPELHLESWLESIDRMRALNVAQLYLPHFGAVGGSLPAHFDALEKCVRRWGDWFRDELRAGVSDEQMVPAFADYLAGDLRAAGASAEIARAYERADPSAMAITAAARYWRKYHPEAIAQAE
ncbi:MAG: MBL fold metallo-hydrolase [Verrucomicrobiota bacterium]|nr:MBL fold metallo-hydrolase [Verrucomicrobiota bacterium]